MRSPTLRSIAVILTLAGAAGSARAGNLNPPPGPPTPTMKTLFEVEPRTAISALPYTITQPGSYYLTRSLTASTGNDTIVIQTSNVTLDLNGFTLDGGPVGQIGICECAAPTLTNWVIRNGTMTNWFSSGISAGNVNGVRIEGLTLINSGLQGMILGDRARVIDTLVMITGGTSSDGIGVGQQAIIDRCTLSGDNAGGSRGINTGADSIVTHSSIKAFNTNIKGASGTSVSHSIVAITSTDGTGVGIELQSNSTVEDNTVSGGGGEMGGRGMLIHGNSNRIDGNHLLNCTTGVAFDFGTTFFSVVFHNSFSSNFQDVFGAAGNKVAPIEDVMVSMNPWANLNN